MAARYALYFAPPAGSAWDRFGKHWLGRCAISGCRVEMPQIPGLATERQLHLTARPRRYGFHATLTAPFRLADDASLDDLMDALETFCLEQDALALPRLWPVHDERGFMSLVPAKGDSRLHSLAARCVMQFDKFRAPLTAAEVGRREAERLSPAQSANLKRWGYPYVLEDFRFHLSLTDRLERSEAGLATRLKDAIISRLPAEPLQLDAISIFAESAPGADFRLLRRIPFAVRRIFAPGRPRAPRVAPLPSG